MKQLEIVVEDYRKFLVKNAVFFRGGYRWLHGEYH